MLFHKHIRASHIAFLLQGFKNKLFPETEERVQEWVLNKNINIHIRAKAH